MRSNTFEEQNFEQIEYLEEKKLIVIDPDSDCEWTLDIEEKNNYR